VLKKDRRESPKSPPSKTEGRDPGSSRLIAPGTVQRRKLRNQIPKGAPSGHRLLNNLFERFWSTVSFGEITVKVTLQGMHLL